jgi:iron(III) transport system ATP-binding protein
MSMDRMGNDTGTAALSLEGLTKRFGKVTAVDNVTLDIPHGRLVTLLGPSGCGKTTILRMIAGLEVPTKGRIYLGRMDITNLPPNERKITMVFQSYALFPHMNVYKNIAYGLKVLRWPEDRIRETVAESLKMVGLEGLENRGPSELSGGQQQRVAVARALVLKPKVLLFDEPLSNLDAKLRKRMRGEIRDLQRDLGITSVYVTHDQSEALAISDQIVVMENAVISQIGGPEELYTRPANPFVADFIGEANIVEAPVLGVNRDTAQIKLGSLAIAVPYTTAPEKGKTAKVMIRPEDILIDSEKREGLIGAVRFAMYQGSTNDYIVETEVGEFRIVDYQTKGMIRERGTQVSLSFREDHIFLIST